MKVNVKLLSTSPSGREYLLTADPGGLSKLVNVSDRDSLIHRMSEADVLYNLASDFGEEQFGSLNKITIEGDLT